MNQIRRCVDCTKAPALNRRTRAVPTCIVFSSGVSAFASRNNAYSCRASPAGQTQSGVTGGTKTQGVSFAGRAQCGVSLRFVPPGTVENSPPFQRWVRMHAIPKVPQGTKDIGPVGDPHEGIARIRTYMNDVNSGPQWFRRLSSLPGLWCWVRSVFPPLKRWASVGCSWRDKRKRVSLGGTKRNVWPSRDGLNVAFRCDSSRQGRLKIAHRFNGGSGCTQFRKSRQGRKILGRLEINMMVLNGFEYMRTT